MLFRSVILRASGLRLVRAAVTKARVFRPLVRRFVAGETVEEALAAAEGLVARGFGVSLDLLGENVATEAEAQAALQEYLQLVEAIGASPSREKVNISIKLTALGLDLGDEVAEANYRALLERAAQQGTFVRVDMESSEYTARTIEIVERAFRDGGDTGTVLQSYLRRTGEDLGRLVALGSRIRLVKGAYLEPESVAFTDKRKVDDQFLEQSKVLLCEGRYPAIATHDARIIEALREFVAEREIDKSTFEWQMLYGIRRDLQQKLLDLGYNVRVYIPFGAHWYPYFTRRLAERPANLAFILRSLFRS